jgi:hypothetical protein
LFVNGVAPIDGDNAASKQNDSRGSRTMAELTGDPGFALPRTQRTRSRRAAAIELMATASLAVSLVIAATAVSLGKRTLAHGDDVERPAPHALADGEAFEQNDSFVAPHARR